MGEVTNQGLPQGGFDLTQFYGVFFEEAGENLAKMESMLLAIDPDQPTDEDLNAIFRVAHSIKGGAATFGFGDVTALTHELETLLDKLRRHELGLKRVMVDVLLEAGDALKGQLARYQGSSDTSPDTSDLIARVKKLTAGEDLEAAGGQRKVLVRIGPLTDGAIADNLAELFRDIPSLGTIEAIDAGRLSADGMRRFAVCTGSPDSELIELFSFHVARDQVAIEPWGAAAQVEAHAPAPAAEAAAQNEQAGFGFFVDPASLPAARAAAESPPAHNAAEGAPAAKHVEQKAKTEKS
ncbi:MAG TPA: Hpt domain-containing protein, partial [Burkholderiaceae bacterium]